jgi:hypothetical protein
MQSHRRIGAGFFVLLFVAGFATFIAHEAAHWLAGVALGHDMVTTLNGTGPRDGTMSAVDHLWVSAAGPAFTILQALVALALVRMRDSTAAYAFLYFAAFMRFMATVISLFHANDEARISSALGLGPWTLPILVTVALAALTWVGSRHLRLSWKTNVLAYLVCTVTVSVIIGLDMLMKG